MTGFFMFSASVFTGALAGYFIAVIIAIAADPRDYPQPRSGPAPGLP
jgi:hypothetical protein